MTLLPCLCYVTRHNWAFLELFQLPVVTSRSGESVRVGCHPGIQGGNVMTVRDCSHDVTSFTLVTGETKINEHPEAKSVHPWEMDRAN